MGVNIRHADEAMDSDGVLPKRILIPSVPPGICFICRSAEKLRSLCENQNSAEEPDDYMEMFSVCYNMEMMYKGKYAEICQACVDRLKDALLFRRQVEAANQSWQHESQHEDDSLPQYDLPLPDEFSNVVVEWPEQCDEMFDICALKSSQETYEVFDMSKQMDETTQPQNINDVFMSQYDVPSPIDSFTQSIEFTWQDETADTGSSAQQSSQEDGEILEITSPSELLGVNWQQETLNGECVTFSADNFRKDQNLQPKTFFNGIIEEFGEILPADQGAACLDKNQESLENCNSADQHTGDVPLHYEIVPMDAIKIIALSSCNEYIKPNEQWIETKGHLDNVEDKPQTKNIMRNKKIKCPPKNVLKMDSVKGTPDTENCVLEEGSINSLYSHTKKEKINEKAPDCNMNTKFAKVIPKLPKCATFCPVCNLVETAHEKLSKHYYTVHFPNFVCQICDKVFHRLSNCKTHTENHDLEKLICKLCDKSYSKRSYLIQHIHIYHKNKKPYACPECPEKFSAPSVRWKHMFDVHNIPCKRHACADCGKEFFTAQHRNAHAKRTHLDLREYKCTECELTFYTAYELKRHMVTHSDERNHSCEKCGKVFKFQKVLRAHQKKHCHLEKL